MSPTAWWADYLMGGLLRQIYVNILTNYWESLLWQPDHYVDNHDQGISNQAGF
jgi:hypothetical protein